MIETKDFFNCIVGENQEIDFCAVKKGSPSISFRGTYDSCIEKIEATNNANMDVYFAPNNRRNDEPLKLNTAILDLYCGLDENGNFYPVYRSSRTVVNVEELMDLPPSSTCLVDTKTGLQMYWSLESGATLKQFQACEHYLAGLHNAERIARHTSLLRVPGTYRCKDPNKKSLCNILWLNEELRYDIGDLIN
jgi:hypothetical protein